MMNKKRIWVLFLLIAIIIANCKIAYGKELNLTVSFDKLSPSKAGDTVTVTAAATGWGNPLYRFWIFNGQTWTVAQAYSPNNIYKWNAAKAGNYKVYVDVKDKYSKNERDSFKEVRYDVNNDIANVSLTADLPSPQTVNDKITFAADASGTGDKLYRFWIYDGRGWSVIKDYSKDNKVAWKPSKVGSHRVWVDVKSVNSLKVNDASKEITYEVSNGIKISKVSFDKASPAKIGDTINISASAEGNNNILYKFWIYDGHKWIVARDYGEDNTYSWTPVNSGKYRVWIDAKDKNSVQERDDYKDIKYEVKSDIAFNSIETNMQSPQNVGNNIIITASCAGSSDKMYRFWVFDGQAWIVARDYTRENQYVWSPKRSGNYRIWVDVKPVNSFSEELYSKEVSYRIDNKPVIESISTNYPSPRKINNTIIVTTNAKNGEDNQYRFWIYDGLSWKVVQDYSQYNTFSWTPIKEGNYRIWVDVKSKRSIMDVEASKEIAFNIVKYGIINYTTYSNSIDYYAQVQKEKVAPVYWDSNKINPWTTASVDQVKYYMNPLNYVNDDKSIYQFLKLTYCDGISVDDLNNVLRGKGVLENKGEVFIKAGKLYNINPIYLVSHSLLETGNGRSPLATGIIMPDGKAVYNMYGIGAIDEDANKYGAEYAYNANWFSIDDAIIGGAKFIGGNYINSGNHQDTLYKMRWNINNVYHQYATDIAWAQNQTRRIKELTDKMKNSIFYFEIPTYK